MKKIDLSLRAHKFLEGLPAKQFRQVALAIFRLAREPFPQDARSLQGYPYHRIDVGEFRIIYRVEEDVVRVALAGKRNDDEVYRQLGRM